MVLGYRCNVPSGRYAVSEGTGGTLGERPAAEGRFVYNTRTVEPGPMADLPPFLFRRFADLQHTEAALVAFANQFGLPDNQPFDPVGWEPEPEADGLPWRPLGYRVDQWRRDIDAMRDVCRVWDALQEGSVDREALDRMGWHLDTSREELGEQARAAVQTELDNAVRVVMKLGVSKEKMGDLVEDAARAYYKEWAWGHASRDTVDAVVETFLPGAEKTDNARAWAGLTVAINKRLVSTSPMFLWPGHQAPSRGRGRQEDRPALMLRPRNLLAALWAQFAFAVDTGQGYRQCAWYGCGNWFPIGLDGSRSSREYCSEACRHKAYRARKGRSVLAGEDGAR